MRIQTASLAILFGMGLGAALCSAQDFSADVVYVPGSSVSATSAGTETPGRSPSKIYVSKEKMRLETRGPAGTVLLINEKEDTAFALVPATKEYEPLVEGISEYFPVKDAENACPDWLRATTEKIDCEKVGHETVGGRDTVKYKNKGASEAGVSAVWIDLSLKYVVKWESSTTGVELRDIQIAPQSSDLFTVPRDYDKSKPRKGNNKGFSNRGR